MADSIQFPPDIPWKRLSTPGVIRIGNDEFGIAPSVVMFYHIPPKDETEDSESRILIIKVIATLTGLRPGGKHAAPILRVALASPGLPSYKELEDLPDEYLPCYGGAINFQITSSDSQHNDRIYVRDMWPRRQEMVVNEVMGTESLNRTSNRVSLTKTWNASASGSYGGVSAQASTSTVSVKESEQEHSQRNSHTINIEHVYHVLTGYYLGGRESALLIQPRPFEGEHWELIGGIRKVEGIQEWVLLLEVPKDASVDILTTLYCGWFWNEPGPVSLQAPVNPIEIAERVAEQIGAYGGLITEEAAQRLEEKAIKEASSSVKQMGGLY